MTVVVVIDRIRIPAYDTVTIDMLEDRELVFEKVTNSLVVRDGSQLIKIPYEPAIIEALWTKMKEYIEANSIIIPFTKPAKPTNGSVYFDQDTNKLYVYVNGEWKSVI